MIDRKAMREAKLAGTGGQAFDTGAVGSEQPFDLDDLEFLDDLDGLGSDDDDEPAPEPVPVAEPEAPTFTSKFSILSRLRSEGAPFQARLARHLADGGTLSNFSG